MQDYRRDCRHTGLIIVALTNDIAIINDSARHALDPGDQAALLGMEPRRLPAASVAFLSTVALPPGR